MTNQKTQIFERRLRIDWNRLIIELVMEIVLRSNCLDFQVAAEQRIRSALTVLEFGMEEKVCFCAVHRRPFVIMEASSWRLFLIAQIERHCGIHD